MVSIFSGEMPMPVSLTYQDQSKQALKKTWPPLATGNILDPVLENAIKVVAQHKHGQPPLGAFFLFVPRGIHRDHLFHVIGAGADGYGALGVGIRTSRRIPGEPNGIRQRVVCRRVM